MLEGALLIRRQRVPLGLWGATYAAGLVFGLALAALILVRLGVPAPALWQEFVVQTFLTSQGLGQTVTAMIPLVLVGLGTALAMRVQFWNIGIEGQLWLGAMAATWVSLHDIGPAALRLPLMLALSMLAGAFWIALPLALKLLWGVSEVISTLLLGSIAFFWVQHQLFGAWRDTATGFPTSPTLDAVERLPLLGWGQVHAGLWLALGAVALAALVIGVTRLGFYARAVGENRRAARAAGLPVLLIVCSFVLGAGALCGLAGAVIVTGTEFRLSQSIGAGYLFSGIVIAYLARSNPLAVLVVSFLLGGLYTAGGVLKVFYGISEAMVLLVQGVVLLSVLAAQLFADFRVETRRAA
ncbi:ABC transporter permease [Pseudooceanicola sp. HF7]|uniref:ABC transporter permease n=1 Tax=Pseudooceanicola sp. HF7 TaxID=2721560 RepID=UPI0014320517|nr:ABC transporter permease [Pseudooceanicola sp. HF7]NIZ07811.1 ABC transporter permease [Pseudooceanicola sp. HF7]